MATPVFLLSSSNVRGQEGLATKPEVVGVSSEKTAELSEFMQKLVDDGKIAGGVTMMARHGKVVHLEAVGMSDREAKVPMKTNSIFRIVSMTKPITSVAVMMLASAKHGRNDDCRSAWWAGDTLRFDPMDLMDQFGFGFTVYSNDKPDKQSQGAYAWFGFWTTSFRISPRGDWIVITMTQLAGYEQSDVWIREYEKIAAESIVEIN
ncbi:serine hydrolase [Novipirellula artificiosorum]|uniref:serine hydrolase n=1 Tax=Novipirellula artificiosorum TaxID=2528016 RepID=UPI0018CE4DB9|nr:serine hydrolase domain-containing protein [Novipirellula artificiosorum]